MSSRFLELDTCMNNECRQTHCRGAWRQLLSSNRCNDGTPDTIDLKLEILSHLTAAPSRREQHMSLCMFGCSPADCFAYWVAIDLPR